MVVVVFAGVVFADVLEVDDEVAVSLFSLFVFALDFGPELFDTGGFLTSSSLDDVDVTSESQCLP